MQNLQITLILKNRIMTNYPYLLLDGIILYGIAEETLGENHPVLSAREPMVEIWDNLPIPLKKTYFTKDKFFYHCSIGRFQNYSVNTTSIHKFFDYSNLKYTKHKKRYNRSGGIFKMERKIFPTINCDKIIFWCVGNKEKLTQILSKVQGLGKKVTCGYGSISKIIIDEIKEDYSIFHPEFGLNRPIPKSLFQEYKNKIKTITLANVSYKPPNWAKSNHIQCILPENIQS